MRRERERERERREPTLSTPTFLKQFCNNLKLLIYSCSSLVVNLTLFKLIHPVWRK